MTSTVPDPPVAPLLPAQRSSRSVTLLVWTLWLVLTAWQAWFVFTYSADMAFRDEVQLSPWVFDERPVTMRWLWAQHFEHRIPLSKSIYLTVMHLSDDGYRATALTSVLFLSAASGVMLRTLSRTRGGGSWLDLGIVLALGTLAHWQNLLAGFQIVFTVTVFLFVCVIASLARGDVLTSSRRVLLLVIPLLFLPLAGAQGLVLALPVALWLGVMSLVVGHKVGRPTALAPRLGAWGAMLTLSLCVLYFIDLTDPFADQRVFAVGAMIDGVVGVLATTFGPGARSDIWALPAALLLGVSLVLPWRAWKHHRLDYMTATGLCAAGVALLLLVVTVGVGRGSIDPGWARWPRYTTLTAPVLVLTCVVLRTCASGAIQKIVGVPVLVVLLLMIPPNTRSAIEAGTERADLFERIRADAIDGTPVDVLTSRYGREINPLMRTRATFERMRTQHVGPWRGETPAPARPVPELLDRIPLDLPIQPTPGPVELKLPDGQHFWAVRWTARATMSSSSRGWVRVNWISSRGPRDQIVQVYPRVTAQTIWLDDVVDRITLTPVDAGTVLQIESAQYLTGPRGQP